MSKYSSLIHFVSKRSISLTAPCESKRNFRKFMLINKRGSRLHKQQQAKSPNPQLEIDHRGVRPTGYYLNGRFIKVPEMVPEIIVPDLKDCEFKPYVSYKVTDVVQSEFTSEQLFNAIYSKKIICDFKEGKLDENGSPLEPSEEEKLNSEEAISRAKRTGSDIF
ncbi:39S ribosomal protein L41-mitochondrial [Plutella xylostella]|uniref:39S ribosomal protein L41-mitochondrial n=1 Tax=Plutella xylostella TaxID=51655 RepID=A0ABQ7R4P0_PLUXY|nr:39S ribosomal protein L41-mitochondrial [Plutella xylostella]